MNAKKRYLTKLIAASVLAFVFLLWMALSSKAQNKSGKPYRVEHFTINTPGNLNVSTSGGYISVKGSKTNKVQVEMYVARNGHRLSPADTDLDHFDIQIKKDGNTIKALAKRHNAGWKFWKNNNISISFVVHAPREMSTDLRTSGGHIEASGLTGNQEINTSGGHIALRDLHGKVNTRTSGGHIEIADVSGQVDARTSGGHIEAHNAKGTLRVHTSGGHIELDDIAGAVKASTSGGHISAQFTKMGKYAELRTSGGGIHITVPENQGLTVNLHGNEVLTQLKNFSGSMKDDDVEGTVNGGGTKLTARTSGGDVRLSFR